LYEVKKDVRGERYPLFTAEDAGGTQGNSRSFVIGRFPRTNQERS